ncbi:MAG: two-component regulator propeller domain-containing protein [Breznakibacter sp.]
MSQISIAWPILLLLLPAYAGSQPYAVEKLGLENGLSDNYILSIAQDNDGFMWFGTEWGLNRFDGHTFMTFKAGHPYGNTVSGSGINRILSDKSHNCLWIATKAGGLNRFDCPTQQFTHYPIHSDKSNSTKANGITDLCFAGDGNIWLATYNNGLKKLDKTRDSIIHYDRSDIPQLKGYKIRSIADDLNGTVYIGHWGEGFSVWSTGNNALKHYTYNAKNPNGLPANEILDICIDSKGNVWLATHRGLALYHPDRESFTVYKYHQHNPNGLSNDDIHSLCEINNQLWIGTWRGGVNILDLNTEDSFSPETARFGHIPSNDLPTGLSSPSIMSVFHDSFGNIWMGSYGEGINVIKHLGLFFKKLSYSSIKGDENGLSDKVASSLCIDSDGLLWVGTGKGTVDVFKADTAAQYYRKVNTLYLDGDVLCAMADGKDNIWFGVDKKGLVRYNKANNRSETIRLGKSAYFNTYVSAIFEDNNHHVWIGTNDGIFVYRTDTKKIDEYNGKDIQLPNHLIRNICQDVNGNIWIGSGIDGLSVVTPGFRLIRHFDPTNGFIAGTVNHIYNDSGHHIWVATPYGVAMFNDLDGQSYGYTVIDQQNKLPDNHIRAITEGRRGEFWIATNAGLSKYSQNEKRTENYDFHDGLPLGAFRNGTVTKAPDGTVIFGTQNGVCYFNTDNDGLEDNALPPVVVSSFTVSTPGGIFGDKSLTVPLKSVIKLPHNQNTFTISFSTADYALEDRIGYAYSLKGASDNWYHTSGQNQVTFRNLAPGKYTFMVKPGIRNKQWSEQTTQLQVEITPPFWFSWWAKAFYLLAIGFAAIAVARFYKRRLDLQNQLYLEKQSHLQAQALNDERLKFYTNVAHELKTPLTLIVGPLDDLASDRRMDPGQSKKISLIQKNARRLYALTNQILEFRRTETQNRSLRVTHSNISGLIREIVLKYKELNRNTEVKIDLLEETASVVYYDREVITIILDNLLSNAFKYTPRGTVTVVLREITVESTRYMEIEVNDTGHGIPDEVLDRIFDRYYQANAGHQVPGTGIGLALVRNLANLHEGSVSVRSKENTGTSFYFRIKKDNAYPYATHVDAPFPMAAPPNGTCPLLLVVEDNDDLRNYISGSFSEKFGILTAKDGQEGLRLALEKMPDMIISDVMMPLMDGSQMCKLLKEDIRTSHIPIILLTAKDAERDKTEGYASGADSYLTKPLSMDLLKTRVDNLLEGRTKIAGYLSSNAYKKTFASDALSQMDNDFIKKVVTLIQTNMQSGQFTVSDLTELSNMGYSSFSKKMKALTDIPANEFIRKIKMQYAGQLLLSGQYTVSEIVHQTGYSSMAYFRKAFKEEFGALPSRYLESLEDTH